MSRRADKIVLAIAETIEELAGILTSSQWRTLDGTPVKMRDVDMSALSGLATRIELLKAALYKTLEEDYNGED